MKLSFEVPIKHLEDFDDLQDFIFALTILLDNDQYRKYLDKSIVQGLKTVWLDNSFNELEVPDHWSELVGKAAWIGAHKVIAPDHPDWPTAKIERNWMSTARVYGPHRTICVVSNYEMFLHMHRLGVQHFAVAFRTRPYWIGGHLKQIQDLTRALHFLGLNGIAELRIAEPASCDTSLPIKLALQGKTVRQWYEEREFEHVPKSMSHKQYYTLEMSTEQIDLARRNICDLKELVTSDKCLVKE